MYCTPLCVQWNSAPPATRLDSMVTPPAVSVSGDHEVCANRGQPYAAIPSSP